MENRIKNYGGEINTDTSVSKILTEKGRAVGLTVVNQSGAEVEREFDLIIATVPSFILPNLVEMPDEYVSKLKQR